MKTKIPKNMLDLDNVQWNNFPHLHKKQLIHKMLQSFSNLMSHRLWMCKWEYISSYIMLEEQEICDQWHYQNEMSLLGVTIIEPNDNICSLNICLNILTLDLVCHSSLHFSTRLHPFQLCSNLIANVRIIIFTSSSLFTCTSLILDATTSPSNLLLIPLCNLFRKLSNFYNELLASYDILSLKLQPLLQECKAI